MADPGTRYTDQQQKVLERRMQEVYAEAQKDLQAKLDDYMRRHKARDARMRAKLGRGEITKKQYDSWMRGQVFMGDQWKAKVKQMTDTLTDANKQSLNILRGSQINVFGENATYEAYEIEKNFGINFGFGMYDSNTVSRLLKDQPELLPRKTVNGRKDAAWNRTKIANCIAQGILQGESLDQIAHRMARDTSSTDMKAMIRYARTAMTGAQNAGRINMLNNALNMGIRVEKKWMATFDNLTRDTHRNLDGQTAPVNQPFKSDSGPILYPGDPHARPENIYNCRCTLVYVYLDYPSEYERYDNIEGHPVKEMTYNEWKGYKTSPEYQHNPPSIADMARELGFEIEDQVDVELYNFYDGRFGKYAYELAQEMDQFSDDNLLMSYRIGDNVSFVSLDIESNVLDGIISTGGGVGTDALYKTLQLQMESGNGIMWLADNEDSVGYYTKLGLKRFANGNKYKSLYSIPNDRMQEALDLVAKHLRIRK